MSITILVIVGDATVGGTTFILSHIKGNFVDIGPNCPTVFDTYQNNYVVEGVPITLK